MRCLSEFSMPPDFLRRIVVALHETIHLMAEIDRVIDAHGGWPLK